MTTQTTPMTAAQQELAAAQQARFEATAAGDLVALAKLMSEDIIYFHSTGSSDTRASYFERLANRPYAGFKSADQVVRVFGDAGLVTAVVTITMRAADGATRDVDFRATSVWAKHDGQWQEQLWQAIRLPEDGAHH